MTNFFIIHGAFGNPQENWFPWLKSQLTKEHNKVFVPEFPTPEGQSLENWMKRFEDFERELNENAIIIGHSIGCAFILALLEKSPKQIQAAFLISGFTGSLGDSELDKLNASFAEREFDWKKIHENCRKFVVFHSDNDPFVPLAKGRELAEKLGAEFVLVKGAGHFNKKAGYAKFEKLFEKIKELKN